MNYVGVLASGMDLPSSLATDVWHEMTNFIPSFPPGNLPSVPMPLLDPFDRRDQVGHQQKQDLNKSMYGGGGHDECDGVEDVVSDDESEKTRIGS